MAVMLYASSILVTTPDRCRCWAPGGGRHQSGRSTVWTSAPIVCFSKFLRAGLKWLQAAGGAEHHDRRVLLVFGRRRDLILCQFERDAVTLVSDAPEMQRVPVYHDFSAADAEKAAEIDDGGAHHSGAIDDHVDDVPHVLVRRATNIPTEHAMRIPCADDSDRRRGCRLFRGGWRRILLLNRLRRVAIGRRQSRVILPPNCGSRQCCTSSCNEEEQTSSAHTTSL